MLNAISRYVFAGEMLPGVRDELNSYLGTAVPTATVIVPGAGTVVPPAGGLAARVSAAGMLPGMSGVQLPAGADQQMARTEAIIKSMTKQERRKPDILNGNRRKRIAGGAGVKIVDVNQLLKQFQQMQTMMKMMKGGGGKKMMRQMEAMQSQKGNSRF